MGHHVETPRVERKEISGERKQKLLEGCSLEKVADEIDPPHVLTGAQSSVHDEGKHFIRPLGQIYIKPMRCGA